MSILGHVDDSLCVKTYYLDLTTRHSTLQISDMYVAQFGITCREFCENVRPFSLLKIIESNRAPII